MKKIALMAVFVFGVSAQAMAYDIGTPVYNADCESNSLAYSISKCEKGYRPQGLISNDLKGQDNNDAIGIVCRHVSKGNYEVGSDFFNRGNISYRGYIKKAAVQQVCDSTEVMAGIACKDLGKNDDALDGCSPVCQKPGGPKHIMTNNDLESNPRSYARYEVDLPNRVTAIGYKEERRDTDRADCATVFYENMPIVK